MARTTLDPNSRCTFLAGTLATIAAASLADSKVQAQSKGSPFVLVHGAWHGGWCWRRVADCLSAKGRYVVAPTLSGVGERSHLASDSIGLSTHIDDVVNEIKWKDFSTTSWNSSGTRMGAWSSRELPSGCESGLRRSSLPRCVSARGRTVIGFARWPRCSLAIVPCTPDSCRNVSRQRKRCGLGRQQDDAASGQVLHRDASSQRRCTDDLDEGLHSRARF